jgi:glycine/D-amino acid oxidase-like deaminating enzyme
MLGGYERDPQQHDGGALGLGFEIAQLPLDLQVLRRLADLVRDQLPIFQEIFARGLIREHRGGLPTVTPDGQKIVGPVESIPGLFVASGCNVGGLSTAPALGEALADLIVDGASWIDMSDMRPERFPLELTEGAGLRAAARRMYAYQYWRVKPAAVSA